MKVSFSRAVMYVPSWNGNKDLTEDKRVRAELKILNLGDLLNVLDALKQADFKSGSETQLNPDQMRVIVKEAGHYIPDHVKLENAEDFSVDDVVQYAQFFGLACELIFQLVEVSSPNKADVKN